MGVISVSSIFLYTHTQGRGLAGNNTRIQSHQKLSPNELGSQKMVLSHANDCQLNFVLLVGNLFESQITYSKYSKLQTCRNFFMHVIRTNIIRYSIYLGLPFFRQIYPVIILIESIMPRRFSNCTFIVNVSTTFQDMLQNHYLPIRALLNLFHDLK